jgi:RNA polymerase sigma factor (sigma-70 family)
MLKPRTRPARGEIDAAALALARRHGAQILATARRYAATPEDAEDAYQRGLEILLTKAPTTSEEELVPWLKTVVKHEAFALRRQRDRHSPVTDDGHLSDRPTPPAITHDQAERLEQLSQGAEALARLKPHEIRALVLKAEGYSYREISELTGWSYTKVNRLLAEGRQAFLRRVAAIQGGGECERLAPLLSALADGEASAEQLALLRPHMRTCLACRAALREFRALPARVAALVPPAGLSADGRVRGFVEGALANLQQKVDAALGAVQHKSAALGERAHAAVELATGQKVAAVAASAAAIAGGGTAVDHFANHGVAPPEQQQQQQQRVEATPVKEETAIETSPAPPEPLPAPAPTPAEPDPAAQQPATIQAPPQPAPAPPPPPPDPADEFTPTNPAVAATPAPVAEAAPAAPAAPTAPAGGSGGGGDAAREFAP